MTEVDKKMGQKGKECPVLIFFNICFLLILAYMAGSFGVSTLGAVASFRYCHNTIVQLQYFTR